MYKKLALALAVANSAGVVMADGAPIEEVLVWGAQVKASSLKLDEEKIALKQVDHISDLLRIIPGVDVGGAHSLNQRITIRSMDDKDLRISIDGANQNTYMYHHMGNLQINADILKSVAIDVGTNSVINGGLGGAVRFETRDAAELLQGANRFGGRANVSVSDNASNNISLTGYGKITDAVDFLGYYNRVDRDNFRVGGGKIRDENGLEEPGTDGEVKGLKGDLGDALIKFGWAINDNHKLKLGYESYKDKGNYSYRPDMGLSTDITIANSLNIPLIYPTEFTRDTYTLNYNGDLGATTIAASVYQNESNLWRDETGLAAWRPPLATINEGDAKNTGANALAITTINGGVRQEISYGFDAIKYQTQYRVDSAELGSEEASVSAVFVQDRIAFNSGLAIIPGIRYESSSVDSHLVDDSFSAPTGALTIEYQVNDNWLYSLSGTQLFRASELAEVYAGAGSGDLANPDIKAEKGQNLQASIAYEDTNFDFGVTVFNTVITDYIYDYAAEINRQYLKDNVGDLRVKGAEIYVGYRQDAWDVLASYSTATSNLNAEPSYINFDGARIDREQGNTFTLEANYRFDRLGLSLHWDSQFVADLIDGKVLDNTPVENSKSGFGVHNISARWQPKAVQGLGLTVGVDNLFDEYYASQSSRTGLSLHPLFGELYLMDYEPGRNVKATISYQL